DATDARSQAASSTVAAMVSRNLRKQLAQMEAKYTPRHPDVLNLQQEIAQWETIKQDLAAAPAGCQKGQAGTDIAERASQPALIDVDSRLQAVTAEIENDKREVDKLRKRIEVIHSHLSLTPMREQQLAEVTRNYENSRQYDQSLLQKKLESVLATNLEKRQQRERFRVIDAASVPQK